jgi:NADPH-dependent ferric siderophore reductase
MMSVTLAGPELEGFDIEDPGASVRLLVPSPGAPGLILPIWNGNEFLLPDGQRPIIRTFTPRHHRQAARELDLDIVVHEGGDVSAWAESAAPGDPAAISGPGRGYTIDPDAGAFLLAGDESAIPAISQLLEALPVDTSVHVHIEVAHPDARLTLPDHPRMTVEWHDLPSGAAPGDALVPAVHSTDLYPDTRVWAAGEAAAMQRIRRYLFEDLEVPRALTTVRGYWKHGRRSGSDDD